MKDIEQEHLAHFSFEVFKGRNQALCRFLPSNHLMRECLCQLGRRRKTYFICLWMICRRLFFWESVRMKCPNKERHCPRTDNAIIASKKMLVCRSSMSWPVHTYLLFYSLRVLLVFEVSVFCAVLILINIATVEWKSIVSVDTSHDYLLLNFFLS